MTEEKQVVVYDITDAAIAKMENLYMGLTVSGPDDETGFKAVHKARKVVKFHRVNVEKRRKELKADALAWGRKVDGEANRIKDLLEPIETHLTAQEKIVTDEKKRIEEAEAKAFQEKIDERVMTLSNYSTDRFNANIPYQKIAIMSDEEWNEYHSKVMQGWHEHQEKIAEEKRIEAERKAAENELLEKVRAEQEKVVAQLAEKQAKIDAEKAEIEAERAKFKAEQDKAEREKAIKETEERARLQAIADEKARVEREAEEAEEKAAAEKAEAERISALLPDKEKAIAWVESMRDSIPKIPAIKDRAIALLVVTALDEIKSVLDGLHRDIEEA